MTFKWLAAICCSVMLFLSAGIAGGADVGAVENVAKSAVSMLNANKPLHLIKLVSAQTAKGLEDSAVVMRHFGAAAIEKARNDLDMKIAKRLASTTAAEYYWGSNSGWSPENELKKQNLEYEFDIKSARFVSIVPDKHTKNGYYACIAMSVKQKDGKERSFVGSLPVRIEKDGKAYAGERGNLSSDSRVCSKK